MTALEEFFGHVLVINLDRRTDRWAHCVVELRKLNLTTARRISAYDGVLVNGAYNGNAGCTASHRMALDLIVANEWPRALILEDDFTAIYDNTDALFAEMVGEVPDDWDMLYLGGHYAERPQYRVSKHVIRMGRMMTTSSYGITLKAARAVAPYITGIGPIDCLYYETHQKARCYITQPRLFVQCPGISDLTGRHNTNHHCMMDTSHENMV